MEIDTGLMASAAPQAAAQTEVDVLKLIAEGAARRFQDVIGPFERANVWLIQRVESTQQWWADDAHTVCAVKINFTHGVLRDANHGSVELHYQQDKASGTSLSFKFTGLGSLEGHWGGGLEGELRNRISQVYAGTSQWVPWPSREGTPADVATRVGQAATAQL
jgi:hypothetical protein